jgi:predicted GNAT superfamily acetyltransferase
MIRDARKDDFDAILTLNREWEHFLSPMDGDRLARLHALSAWHRVVEQEGHIVAFLLAFADGSDYDSSNYRWFDERFDRFLYVDRVVVSGSSQGRGLGAELYRDLMDYGRRSGRQALVCEFDIEPPNPGSRAFHERFGFHEVGVREYGESIKRVSLRYLGLQ